MYRFPVSYVLSLIQRQHNRFCTSGSVVEYRLAKARVAGSNPVSCSQRDRKKSHPMDGSFFYVQALPGSNGSNVSALLWSSQSNVPRTFCDVSCSQ